MPVDFPQLQASMQRNSRSTRRHHEPVVVRATSVDCKAGYGAYHRHRRRDEWKCGGFAGEASAHLKAAIGGTSGAGCGMCSRSKQRLQPLPQFRRTDLL